MLLLFLSFKYLRLNLMTDILTNVDMMFITKECRVILLGMFIGCWLDNDLAPQLPPAQLQT